MGFRFRKSVSIIPGLSVNFSNGTPSLSIGPRGASVSVGKRGTYANLGLPGTGLSYRTRLDKAARTSSRNVDENALAQHREQLEHDALSLQEAIDAITNIHELTPDPSQGQTMDELVDTYWQEKLGETDLPAPVRPGKPQPVDPPAEPTPDEGVGILSKWLESAHARQLRQEANQHHWELSMLAWKNEQELVKLCYQQQRMAWAEQYALWQFEIAERQRLKEIYSGKSQLDLVLADTAYFEQLLNLTLQQTIWPRETLVSYQVEIARSTVFLDVDLPEIEVMPDRLYAVNAKGSELTEKPFSQKRLREAYARHVHGCLLRLAGIVLTAIPLENVVVSGFTQRLSRKTGYLDEEYILSCEFTRSGMLGLNFSNIDQIDPIAALERFNLVRNMTITCIFHAIEPLKMTIGTH
ncbi:DUF4236 domain-containing protein [Serratia plymuthica]|uniref:DUF4236 domain-containing protein n=1 Tax=Serratia plymuthica TaxID=82996 RepID=UPI003DA272F5